MEKDWTPFMGYDSLRIELRYRHIWQTKWSDADRNGCAQNNVCHLSRIHFSLLYSLLCERTIAHSCSNPRPRIYQSHSFTSPLTHIRSPEEQTRSRFTGAAAVAEGESAGAGEAGGRGVSTATCITRAAAADGGSNRTHLQWATVSTTKVREREGAALV